MDTGKLFGRGISFPPRVGPDGRVVWSEGEANVRECIEIVLMIFVSLLNIIFWWMPFLKICFPIPVDPATTKAKQP